MLTLTLRQVPTIPLEVETLLPERLAALSNAEIERLTIAHGNRTEPVGEWFAVDGDARDETVDLIGDCRKVKRIGERMTTGSLHVTGPVGMHAGAMMRGGTLTIDGDAGDWLGAEISGGSIVVRGLAGSQIGAAYRGSRRGMTGGTITIDGNAGDEVGLLMRRGLIVVNGHTGEFTGASMIAGTIRVGGTVGPHGGAGMKRGTIVTAEVRTELPPGFEFSCEYEPVFARLLFPSSDCPAIRVQCYRGDRVNGGRGEVWILSDPSAEATAGTDP